MKKRIRQRYCKFCGGAIDIETKQCERCGKQYFHFRVAKKGLPAAVQCLLVIALVSIIIVQYAQYKADTEKCNAEISSLIQKVEDLDLQIIRKDSEKKDLQNEIFDAESRLEFFDNYVVFVPLGESAFMDENEYHKQSCSHFKKHLLWSSQAEFSALDVAMAEYLGYKPCPDCCD